MKIDINSESIVESVINTDSSEKQETTHQNVQIYKDAPAPLVEILNGALFTTSLNVAAVYGKAHFHVLRDIEQLQANLENAEEAEPFDASNFGWVEYADAKGERRRMCRLSRDSLVLLVMGYNGPKAMSHKLAYMRAFNAMEAKLKEGLLSIPDFDDPVAAARAWADERERRVLAEKEKVLALERADEAVRARAWIGNRREATAMATASAQKRRADKAEAENAELKDERGRGKNFKTVTNISWISQIFNVAIKGAWSQIGRALSKLTKALGLETRKVPGEKFDVQAYPVRAIEEFKRRVDSDPEYLKKYRFSES